MKILIKNGRVIDPSVQRDGMYDILVDGEKVAQTAENISEELLDGDDLLIDASGCYVVPGLIDMHVHLREPGFEYKETIKTGAMAAARGGFTTICPMPNTKPVIDSPEMVEWIVKKAKEDAPIHVLPVGAVTKGQLGKEMTDIAGMAKAGAAAISEDGKSVMDARIYEEAMREAKKAGIIVMAHCEDRNLVGQGALNAGKKAEEIGVAGIGNEVEDVIAARDILLAKATGCRLHLCHCSTQDSVKMIRAAKADGIDVSGEVCPHHFTLTEDDIISDDANFKMNPPLRSSADRQMLIEGLSDGTMEAISTDHAPHHADEKAKGIAKAPFGIVGSETALALAMTELVGKGKLTPYQLVERMSWGPAKRLGIDKGSLKEGKMADITIIDPKAQYRIDASKFVSKGKNTPFDGYPVTGRVMTTIAAGKVVYQYNND
ncbi:MAG TPA: dihydroorotase [Candidatus Scybalocola faecipullorum]|nr:dihydroorotase [Candidatus Scybalocola faecipullorum]